MKSLHRLSFLLLISVLLTSSSCIGKLFGKDDDDVEIDLAQVLNDRLQGDWEVESYRVDRVELIPQGFETFFMEFSQDEPNDGTTDWDIESNVPDIIATGTYTLNYRINDGGEEIVIDGETYDITVDGNSLRLDATIEGEDHKIRAVRD